MAAPLAVRAPLAVALIDEVTTVEAGYSPLACHCQRCDRYHATNMYPGCNHHPSCCGDWHLNGDHRTRANCPNRCLKRGAEEYLPGNAMALLGGFHRRRSGDRHVPGRGDA